MLATTSTSEGFMPGTLQEGSAEVRSIPPMAINADEGRLAAGDQDLEHQGGCAENNTSTCETEALPLKPPRKRRRRLGHSKQSDHQDLARHAELSRHFHGVPASASLSTHRLNDYVMISEKLSNRYTARLLHYSVTTFWPGFDPGPGSSSLHIPPFISDWVPLSIEDPALFHTALWAAALHSSVQTQKPIHEHEALEHHQLALQNIAREVTKPIESISEATILAVLGVATRELVVSSKPKEIGEGFHPPFPNLQWLHAYGRRPYISVHEKVWVQLVEMKGGIDCIALPSFASLMQYTDVIGSTLRLRHPCFPVCHLFSDMQKGETRHNYFGHDQDFVNEDLLSCTESVSASPTLVKHGLSNQMLQVMLDLHTWTGLLRRYASDSILRPDLSRLAIHRNLIQHRLLCTVPADEDINRESDMDCAIVFNSCGAHLPDITKMARLSLLLFSIGVTFPISYKRPFKVLVQRLKRQVATDFSSLYSASLNKFLIWVCMIGGIGAAQCYDETSRSWFVDIITRIEETISAGREAAITASDSNSAKDEGEALEAKPVARTWERVKDACLLPFVWHDEACDFGGRLIWEEVRWRVDSSS